MSKALCIICPSPINARSETFIQRHMQDLLPGKTAVITHELYSPNAVSWSKDVPILVMQPETIFSQINSNKSIIKTIAKKLIQRFSYTENNWINLSNFLKENQVKIIMGEYLDLSLPWLEIAQKFDIKFFVHAHGYDVSEMIQYPEWRKKYLAYNQADGIITMSEFSRQKLLTLGLYPEKVHIVPYGVNVPVIPIKRSQQDTVNCLAVGRMVTKKAPIKTLVAFSKAVKVCPELRLDYVGEGELLSIVKKFIQEFNLNDKVTLHGSQPNKFVLELMKKADIFLQHSVTVPDTGDEEGLPVAILEAMGHSLPIISTRHAGIPEAVMDGSTGYLVDEGDSSAMADYIVKLASDFQMRQSFGASGWQRAKEYFSWEKEQKALLNILGLIKPEIKT